MNLPKKDVVATGLPSRQTSAIGTSSKGATPHARSGKAGWVIASRVPDRPWWGARRHMPRSPQRPYARCLGPDGQSR